MPQYYRHSDWLGSSRLASKPDRTIHFDGAYAPFGEDYAKTGTTDLNFTGQNQDTVPGLYDFLFREYSPVQGRWISPDPAGLEAVDLADPQSWNRYAYVVNSPLNIIDPLGLTGEDKPKLECLLSDTGGCLVQVGVVGGRCWDNGLLMPCGIKFTLIRAGALVPGCTASPFESDACWRTWIDPMTGFTWTPCKGEDGLCVGSRYGLSPDQLQWLKDFATAFLTKRFRREGEAFGECVKRNIRTMTLGKIDPDVVLDPKLYAAELTAAFAATQSVVRQTFSGPARISVGAASLLALTRGLGLRGSARLSTVRGGIMLLRGFAVAAAATAGTLVGSGANCAF